MHIIAEKGEGQVLVTFSEKEEQVMPEDYARDIQDCATGMLGIAAARLANEDINDTVQIIHAISANAINAIFAAKQKSLSENDDVSPEQIFLQENDSNV